MKVPTLPSTVQISRTVLCWARAVLAKLLLCVLLAVKTGQLGYVSTGLLNVSPVRPQTEGVMEQLIWPAGQTKINTWTAY